MSQAIIPIPSDSEIQPTQIQSSRHWLWLAGVTFGIGTQGLFFYTVYYLFQFLRHGVPNQHAEWLLVDLALATGFAIPHSLLLAPAIQTRLKRYCPSGLLGCVHCFVTCLSLLVMFHCWKRSELYIWHVDGSIKVAILASFYLSWLGLFYSLWLTGMGYQTGLTQWWYWARRVKPPQRPFITHGAFRYMRHPVYMSFLGLIWFTPTMTFDHAVLTIIWTVYIYLGSYLKDQRLLRYIGRSYYDYGKRVSGLPVIGIGSLRRFT